MAETEAPQRPTIAGAVPDAEARIGAANPIRDGLLMFAAAVALYLVGYLVATVPGTWFPAASAKRWAASELVFSRGVGGLEDGEVVVTDVDAAGTALLAVETDFRSGDYRAIAWDAIDVPDQANVRLLWRTDYAPGKLNSVAITVAAGRLLPATVAKDPNWIGRIRGLALLIQGPMPGAFRVHEVVAKPMGATELVADRGREWLTFEGFNGTSIDSAGGADGQDLPLPVLLALAATLAAAAAYALAKARGRMAALPAILATVFLAARLLQDARWAWDLARPTRATGLRYAGRDARERHLAAEDRPLYAFVEKVCAKLPSTPARAFVAADAHYFRGRGAYHLYPHNVLFDPYANTMPASTRLRSGDYVVVWQWRGVQYDPGAQRLRWDGGEPIAAELLMSEPGAALFRIR